MANKIYDNFYLSNEVEDQFNSHLNLQQFCTVDNSLTGTAGMTRKINVYTASSGTEKLTMGQGNTKTIEVSHRQREYKIGLAQNRFSYYDEEEMTDPMLVPVGTKQMGTAMFNTVNDDIYGEFKKAPRVVVAPAIGFDGFVDAVAAINIESTDNDPNVITPMAFSFVNGADVAELRKALKDDLKYVESFVRTGYVGTVGGVNIYTKKDATKGTIVVATKKAVTMFTKKGTEIEQERDKNIRKNTIYSRKYYIVALTNETKVVRIVKGTVKPTADTSVVPTKTYYAKLDMGYIVAVPKTNPKTEGFFEVE